jgi:hypothetical protein
MRDRVIVALANRLLRLASKDYQDQLELVTKIGMLHLERAMKMHRDMESPRDGTNGANGTQAIGPVAEGSPQKGTQGKGP